MISGARRVLMGTTNGPTLPGLCCLDRQKWHTITWWKHASNPGDLQSFLHFPDAYPAAKLYVLPRPFQRPHPAGPSVAEDSTVALFHESRETNACFHIFGNLAAQSDPDYSSVFESIIASDFPTVRFIAMPEAAVSIADRCFAKGQYEKVYHSPCWQYSLRGPPPAHVRSTWQQLVSTLPPGYTLGPLLPQDAELVNDTWKFK
jgi:hypothetical protein